MIEIGKLNKLKVERFTDHGAYLTDSDGAGRVLLPKRYLWGSLRIGEELEVFVYTDSEDRPIATTEIPLATVGDVALLEVVGANRFGAFLDWGLPKDLLVPLGEQKSRMKVGGKYPVYVYLDHASQRVVASAKIDKFIGNLFPDLKRGDSVEAFVYERADTGWRVAVEGHYKGMIFDDEIFAPVAIGSRLQATVKSVRPDGKLDLLPVGKAEERVPELAQRILAAYQASDGRLEVNDQSSPAEIKEAFGCSKKDFKKALGQLLKERKIDLSAVRGIKDER